MMIHEIPELIENSGLLKLDENPMMIEILQEPAQEAARVKVLMRLLQRQVGTSG